jgi:pyrroloquinoline quinone biosynthesis protein D
MERLELSSATVLRLGPHIVFRFDDTRQRWIMLAPERLMLPDEQAVEILQLVDGKTSVGTIIDTLAQRYTQATREEIGGDVTAMLQELVDKGCLTNDRID